MTDSQNLCTFLTKDSTKEHIQTKVFDLFEKCQKRKFVIKPVHLPRSDPRIELADEGSRESDPDSWEIGDSDLRALEDEFGKCNKKKALFVSKFNYGQPMAVDALSINWGKLGEQKKSIYICPPIKFVIACVKKIAKERSARGIMLVPAWRAATFWPFVFPGAKLNGRFKKAKKITCGVKRRPTAKPYMHGKKEFYALQF